MSQNHLSPNQQNNKKNIIEEKYELSTTPYWILGFLLLAAIILIAFGLPYLHSIK